MDDISNGTPNDTVQVNGAPTKETLPMGVVSVNIDPTKSAVLDFNSKMPREVRGPKIPRNVRRSLGM
jgi:hypothetical protein